MTEIFTDLLRISSVFKRFGWKNNLKLLGRNKKKLCEYKTDIVCLPQSVCKCQIQIPKGGKS